MGDRQIDGLWQIPGLGGQANGILLSKFSETGELHSLQLESSHLGQSDGDGPRGRFSPLVVAPAVFGDDGGQKVTLFDVSGTRTTWSPLAYLGGLHVSPDDVTVSQVESTVINLEPLLQKLPGGGAKVFDVEDVHLVDAPKTGWFFQKLIERVGACFLGFGTNYEQEEHTFNFSLKTRVRLVLRFNEPKTLPAALSELTGLCQLFSLLGNVPVKLIGPVLIQATAGKGHFYFLRPDGVSNEHNHYPLARLESHEMLGEAVSTWFALSTATKAVIARLAEFMHNNGHNVEEDFLEACRLAESLARALNDDCRVQVPRDGKRRTFEDCMRTIFKPLLRSQPLRRALSTYEPVLGARPGTEPNSDQLNEFFACVVWTRDELTHIILDAPKTRGRVLTPLELRTAANTVTYGALGQVLDVLLPGGLPFAESKLANAYGFAQQGRMSILFAGALGR